MLDGWYCRSIASVQQANAAAGASGGSARTPGDTILTSQTSSVPHSVSEPHMKTKKRVLNQTGAGGAGQIQVAPRAPEPQHEYSSDSSSSDQEPELNYRTHYLALKNKLKYLIYENECFQDALRSSQRRMLKVSRDRTFLLDRLLQYEKPETTTSESEETESSDDADIVKAEHNKSRKKAEPNSGHHSMPTPPAASKGPSAVRRKRAPAPKKPPQNTQAHPSSGTTVPKAPPLGTGLTGAGDGHMTPEEVERHLQSRQSYLELLPERAPPTVPTEMFSNDPSLDSESNDILENSPNVDEWVE